jgi:hypothetical protein
MNAVLGAINPLAVATLNTSNACGEENFDRYVANRDAVAEDERS